MKGNVHQIAVVALALGVAVCFASPERPNADSLKNALNHLSQGRPAQAEQAALNSGGPQQAPTARAWLIVAAARQQRGQFAQAVEAYEHFLTASTSAELREYVTQQIQLCRSRQMPAKVFQFPSSRLSANDLATLAHVGSEVFVESSEHFVVRSRNARLSKLVAVEAEKALRRICGDVLAGRAYAHSVDINIWPNRKEFAANATSSPEWSAGGFTLSSSNGVITRRIDLTQRNDAGRFDTVSLDRVLPHEMCHLVLHEYFGDTSSPLFLDEGMAMLAEGRLDNTRLVLAGTILASDKPKGLGRLLTTGKHNMADPNAFYAKALSFMQFLRQRLSRKQFSSFLENVKDGCSADDAIQRALVIPDSEGFQNALGEAWRQHAILQGHYLRALKDINISPAANVNLTQRQLN